MRNSRSAIFTWMNFVKSAGLGLIAGACFFDLGDSEMYVADRSGFAFFAMTYWVFDGECSLSPRNQERHSFKKNSRRNLTHTLLYNNAHKRTHSSVHGLDELPT